MDDYTSNDVEILLLAACKLVEFSVILEEELKKNYSLKIDPASRTFLNPFSFCTMSRSVHDVL